MAEHRGGMLRQRRRPRQPLGARHGPRRRCRVPARPADGWKIVCADSAHSSIESAARAMDVTVVTAPVDRRGHLTGDAVNAVLTSTAGVFAVVATAGTTNDSPHAPPGRADEVNGWAGARRRAGTVVDPGPTGAPPAPVGCGGCCGRAGEARLGDVRGGPADGHPQQIDTVTSTVEGDIRFGITRDGTKVTPTLTPGRDHRAGGRPDLRWLVAGRQGARRLGEQPCARASDRTGRPWPCDSVVRARPESRSPGAVGPTRPPPDGPTAQGPRTPASRPVSGRDGEGGPGGRARASGCRGPPPTGSGCRPPAGP